MLATKRELEQIIKLQRALIEAYERQIELLETNLAYTEVSLFIASIDPTLLPRHD